VGNKVTNNPSPAYTGKRQYIAERVFFYEKKRVEKNWNHRDMRRYYNNTCHGDAIGILDNTDRRIFDCCRHLYVSQITSGR